MNRSSSARRLQQLHAWLRVTTPAGSCWSAVQHHSQQISRAATTAVTAASQQQVTLYTARSSFPAFNGWKITILLEELKAAGALTNFSVVELDLDSLEHKKPWFLALNPNGRIPALVDHTAASEINSSGSDSAVGGEGEAEGSGGFALWESGAIMLYLAERFGCFLPSKTPRQRWDTLSWLAFQLSGVGPIQGQAHAFTRYVPERIPYAIDRFQAETRRLYEVLDTRLAAVEAGAQPVARAESAHAVCFLAGAGEECYSIADIAIFPWVEYHEWAGVPVDGLHSLQRWLANIRSRPAVQRGLEYNKKDLKHLLADQDAIRATVGATTLDTAAAKPKSKAASRC